MLSVEHLWMEQDTLRRPASFVDDASKPSEAAHAASLRRSQSKSRSPSATERNTTKAFATRAYCTSESSRSIDTFWSWTESKTTLFVVAASSQRRTTMWKIRLPGLWKQTTVTMTHGWKANRRTRRTHRGGREWMPPRSELTLDWGLRTPLFLSQYASHIQLARFARHREGIARAECCTLRLWWGD